MENLTRRRIIAIATAISGCLAITVIASQPSGSQTDHSCYVGFPVPFREWGEITLACPHFWWIFLPSWQLPITPLRFFRRDFVQRLSFVLASASWS